MPQLQGCVDLPVDRDLLLSEKLLIVAVASKQDHLHPTIYLQEYASVALRRVTLPAVFSCHQAKGW